MNRKATTANRILGLATQPLASAAIAIIWSVAGFTQGVAGEDYLHGRQQVFHMLAERSAMSTGLIDNDPLVAWTAAQFAGSRTKRKIWWDSTVPATGIDASHQWGEQPSLRVHPVYQSGPRRGQRKTFSDSWADVIFELHNLAQSPVYETAWQDVREHRLTAPQWLEVLTRGEHRALLYTQAFHRTRWRIWMRSRGAAPTSGRWIQIAATPSDYLSWIAHYSHASGYPYRDYLPGYRKAMRQSEQFGLNLEADPFSFDALFQRQPVQP